jgi:hypothetical protein
MAVVQKPSFLIEPNISQYNSYIIININKVMKYLRYLTESGT